jgi:hypothetical protein
MLCVLTLTRGEWDGSHRDVWLKPWILIPLFSSLSILCLYLAVEQLSVVPSLSETCSSDIVLQAKATDMHGLDVSISGIKNRVLLNSIASPGDIM